MKQTKVAKAIAYILSTKQNARAMQVIALCSGLTLTYGEVTEKCHALFAAEFPSTAHVKEVAHYKAFSKALRPNGGVPFEYKLFLVWVRGELHGIDKETGKPKGSALPGRAKGGKGSKLTIGRFANAWESRGTALTLSIKEVRKAGLFNAEIVSKITAALAAYNDAQEAIAECYEEDKEAREEQDSKAA